MGFSLETVREHSNVIITIKDGMVCLTPGNKEEESEKANEHLGVHREE